MQGTSGWLWRFNPLLLRLHGEISLSLFAQLLGFSFGFGPSAVCRSPESVFCEVWGLLPAFSMYSVGVVPHVDVFLMYWWEGRWSPRITPPPSWRSLSTIPSHQRPGERRAPAGTAFAGAELLWETSPSSGANSPGLCPLRAAGWAGAWCGSWGSAEPCTRPRPPPDWGCVATWAPGCSHSCHRPAPNFPTLKKKFKVRLVPLFWLDFTISSSDAWNYGSHLETLRRTS